MPGLIGQVRWQVPGLQFDEDNVDLLRAKMACRVSRRDLACSWQGASRQLRFYLATGAESNR